MKKILLEMEKNFVLNKPKNTCNIIKLRLFQHQMFPDVKKKKFQYFVMFLEMLWIVIF